MPEKRELTLLLVFPMAVALMSSLAYAQGGQRSGIEVVNKVCAACHASGTEGAPQIGDVEGWSNRAAQGLTNLTLHALEGIRGMPAHGGQPELTDLEIARAVAYMVNLSGGDWVEPMSAAELAAERSGEQVVRGMCIECHREGVGGAPKIGDLDAWVPRIKRGFDYLVRSAVHGHGGMPPRGGQADLTDSEIRSAIVYMYYPVGATAKVSPAAAKQPAATASNHRSVAGMDIYLGLISAEQLRELPEGSLERSMHGGVPAGSGYFHLNASLYDQKSHAPVTGATVTVQLDHSGSTSITRELEPMAIGGYGFFVKPQRRTRYEITLQIERPGKPGTVEATFEHSFQ